MPAKKPIRKPINVTHVAEQFRVADKNGLAVSYLSQVLKIAEDNGANEIYDKAYQSGFHAGQRSR